MIKDILLKIKLYIKHTWFKLRLWIQPSAIDYISGVETLPPPLSHSEEQALLVRLEQGDFTVRKTLIERNLRLVVYIARKFDNTGILIDDLVSIGSIGLIKAVNTFDVSKRIKLATYASRCIENEILMFLRRNNKTKLEISLDEPLNVDWDGNELLLSDVLIGTDSELIFKNLEHEVDLRLLNGAMMALNKRERVIIELRFGLNRPEVSTQKEVADTLGISQSYVSRLEKKIIKRLQKEFEKIS